MRMRMGSGEMGWVAIAFSGGTVGVGVELSGVVSVVVGVTGSMLVSWEVGWQAATVALTPMAKANRFQGERFGRIFMLADRQEIYRVASDRRIT